MMGFGLELEYKSGKLGSYYLDFEEMWSHVFDATRGCRHEVSRDEDTRYWTVKTDCTIGYEITTPILEDLEDLTQVVESLEASFEKRFDLELLETPRAGLHIHIGRQDTDWESFYNLIWNFEETLIELQKTKTGNHRKSNSYCGRIRRGCHRDGHSTGLNRSYHLQTYEVRYGQGTGYAWKVLGWTSLVLTLAHEARRHKIKMQSQFDTPDHLMKFVDASTSIHRNKALDFIGRQK